MAILRWSGLKKRSRIKIIVLSLFFAGFGYADTVYCSDSLSLSNLTRRYDVVINRETAKHAPWRSPKRHKAQLIQESWLNPNAKSPVGAAGLGQFMPGTWRDVCRPLLLCHKSRFDPVASITASTFYMSRLYYFWRTKRPFEDRQKLAEASYNAGAGNLLKAQKKCNGATLYDCIIKCLPMITGHHSNETINYVKRIERIEKRVGI